MKRRRSPRRPVLGASGSVGGSQVYRLLSQCACSPRSLPRRPPTTTKLELRRPSVCEQRLKLAAKTTSCSRYQQTVPIRFRSVCLLATSAVHRARLVAVSRHHAGLRATGRCDLEARQLLVVCVHLLPLLPFVESVIDTAGSRSGGSSFRSIGWPQSCVGQRW